MSVGKPKVVYGQGRNRTSANKIKERYNNNMQSVRRTEHQQILPNHRDLIEKKERGGEIQLRA